MSPGHRIVKCEHDELDKAPGHIGRHGCGFKILPSLRVPSLRVCAETASKQWRERTHGCWCSSWKYDEEHGWYVWRNGCWYRPRKGEFRDGE